MSTFTTLTEKKNPEELRKLLAEKREALRALRFHGKGTHVRNTKEASLVRKDIARVLTRLQTLKTSDLA